MKKRISKIALALSLAAMIIAPTVKAQAGTVESVDVSAEGGNVAVSGSTSADTLAVSIMVYDESGKDLVKMISTSVDSNQHFGDAVELANGKYVVKVADYEGGSYTSKELEITDSSVVAPSTEDDKKVDETTKKTDDKTATSDKKDAETTAATKAAKTGDSRAMEMTVLLSLVGITAAVVTCARKKVKE